MIKNKQLIQNLVMEIKGKILMMERLCADSREIIKESDNAFEAMTSIEVILKND